MASFFNFFYSRWFYLFPLFIILIFFLFSLNAIIDTGVKAIDKTTLKSLQQHVDVIVNLEQRRLKELLSEYTYWDEGYKKLVLNPDKQWANENINQYFNDDLSLALTFIINPDNSTGFVFHNGQATQLPFSLQLIKPSIHKVKKQRSKPKPETQFIQIGQQFYLIALDSFIPEFDHSSATDGTIFGIGRLFDQAYLEQIAVDYQFSSLKLITNKNDHPIALQRFFYDHLGNYSFSFSWDAKSIAKSVHKQMWGLVTLVGYIIFILLVWLIYLVDKRYFKQEKILIHQANYDSLTNIRNRRSFFEQAEHEYKKALREQKKLFLLLLDIDYFKVINDTYGHHVGDSLLKEFTTQIQKMLREVDLFARFGGEEFVILLHNTPEQPSIKFAERIRQHIETMRINIDGITVGCTVSIGISSTSNYTLEQTIKNADIALYKAKTKGRNQTVLYHSSLK